MVFHINLWVPRVDQISATLYCAFPGLITFEGLAGDVLSKTFVSQTFLLAREVEITSDWQQLKKDKKFWSYMPKTSIKSDVFLQKRHFRLILVASSDYGGCVFELFIVSELNFWY